MAKSKVLYIEDNADNMTLVKRVLEVEGYEVIGAANGTEGLKTTHRSSDTVKKASSLLLYAFTPFSKIALRSSTSPANSPATPPAPSSSAPSTAFA